MPDGAADLIHALLKVNPEERLSLSAALCWPWLQKMRTDPLETDDEVAIPIDDTETEPLREAKTSAFLLSSCLEPASGLHFSHVANMPPDISSRKHLAKNGSVGRCWESRLQMSDFHFTILFLVGFVPFVDFWHYSGADMQSDYLFFPIFG